MIDIRFTSRWVGFSMEELERMLWMTEYYTNQDDLTFDLGEEIRNEIRRRDLWMINKEEAICDDNFV